MGRVYEAVQDAPLRRSVALKLLRMDVAAVSAPRRFRQEQAALARLDHPAIAGVFAAGISDEGSPYVAMELVRGSSITEFCDRRQLSVPDRVRLLIEVLDGITHAHQNGVIHRDPKPSNVLVDEAGDRAAPKVVDFGIALVEGDEDGHVRLTKTGEVIGTPAYMAPELLVGGSDPSEATDVYSLGVLAYELLVGNLPFASSAYRYPAVLGLASQTPPRLRRRLSTIASTQETLARTRGTDVRTLRLQLGGTLERIIAKAVEPAAAGRIPSAAAFKRDLVAHLEGGLSLYDSLAPLRTFSRGWSRLQTEGTQSVAAKGSMGFAIISVWVTQGIGPYLERSVALLVLAGFLGAQATVAWVGMRIDTSRGRNWSVPFLVTMVLLNGVITVSVIAGLLGG